ncbi:MAG: ATP-binding cassette domain-containing protein, partial [Melioribacteraceae bacterium]|nr:ATP-binding cassette domain-containing protein [Melioribacteraceae bacterium]
FNTDLDFESCQDIINKVGLHGYEEHFPHNESFGFRFRVSLARAIANNADLIILDEPFNHLNSITRLDLYKLIRNLHLNDNFTFFLGTSNISEAIFLSEKVNLLSSSPSELIDEIEIKLPQKRSSEIFESSEFIEIRSSIENILLKSSQDKFYNFSL